MTKKEKLEKGEFTYNVVPRGIYSIILVCVDGECVEEQEWTDEEIKSGIQEFGTIRDWIRHVAITNLENDMEG